MNDTEGVARNEKIKFTAINLFPHLSLFEMKHNTYSNVYIHDRYSALCVN